MAKREVFGLMQAMQNMASLLSPLMINRSTTWANASAQVAALPTGFRTLDKALETGGLPYGRLTELIGPHDPTLSGGPTCLAAAMAAKVQRQQERVTIVDLNHSFDAWQAERCGLTAPHLLLVRPDTLFSALTALERATHSSTLIIILMGVVLDLLDDIEPDLLLTLLRRLHGIVRRSNSAFLVLTAPYELDPFVPTNYPPGFPLPEIADVRLWVQTENWTYKDGLTTAYKAQLTIIKNNLGLPGKAASVRVKFNNFGS